MTIASPLAALSFRFARVNALGQGDTTVIASVPGKRIIVVSYTLTTSATGTVTVQGSAGSGVFAQFSLAINGTGLVRGLTGVPGVRYRLPAPGWSLRTMPRRTPPHDRRAQRGRTQCS